MRSAKLMMLVAFVGGCEPKDEGTTADLCDAGGDPEATCVQRTDRAGCEAAAPGGGECVWYAWTRVAMVGDACSFTPEQGECHYSNAKCQTEGCPGIELCGVGPDSRYAIYRTEASGEISIAFASPCDYGPGPGTCFDEMTGELRAECACLCDADFPAP